MRHLSIIYFFYKKINYLNEIASSLVDIIILPYFTRFVNKKYYLFASKYYYYNKYKKLKNN